MESPPRASGPRCTKKLRDGVLHRVNPKGEPGIFMCAEHARSVSSWEQRAQSQDSSEETEK